MLSLFAAAITYSGVSMTKGYIKRAESVTGLADLYLKWLLS